MDAKAFETGEEATCKLERASLRSFISMCHSEMLSDKALDLTIIKAKFASLCDVQNKFVAHELARTNGDAEKEMESHTKYTTLMREIVERYEPKKTSAKLVDMKLPKVVANDPTSWKAFKTLLDRVSQHHAFPEEDKFVQLAKSLPPKVAMRLDGKSFDEAVTLAKQFFESAEVLVEIVRANFRALPRIEGPFDLSNIKRLQEEVDNAIALSTDTKVVDKAYKKAISALPRQMQWGFIDSSNPLTLVGLNSFLKRRIIGTEQIEPTDGVVKMSTRERSKRRKANRKRNCSIEPSPRWIAARGRKSTR